MKENKITDHYNLHPVIPSLLESVNSDQFKNIGITGLSGSSKAMILSLVFHKTQCAHVVVIPEKEDAAYFYNDLVSLLGEDSVFFFPSFICFPINSFSSLYSKSALSIRMTLVTLFILQFLYL